MNPRLKDLVFNAVRQMPVGKVFTTAEISEKVPSRYAGDVSIAMIIRQVPGVINLVRPPKKAQWRREE